ncbi:vitamin K epoxide reductase family protein [Spirosoma endbachense]|uniref:Thioredoxin domain-containing protein n=1 Tax=Spirosoma endbachense TaxID=2666025 RepID=A0A6P1VRP8_9BACT|nr:vitamin K epoxide reductase family protein [Spirosoma endbachense]QHV94036.1 thioredoxin domain-containing protein [Spirosoma endbachense]
MALFDTLSNTTDENATATLYALVKELGAKVTRATVQEELSQHPDFPSLLSLSDLLTDWHIDNTAFQLNTTEQLRELPVPFVAHLRKNGGWYVLVTALTGNRITYSDNTQGRKSDILTDFEKNWSGIVLLAETNEQSGESDYIAHRKREVLNELRGPFAMVGSLLIFFVIILSVAKDLKTTDWFLLATKATGLLLSGLLVAKQLGSKNALTDRLCSINAKTNCDDVLNSPAAKLWGWLSWTDVGLLYFAGGLLAVLLVSVQPQLRSLLYWLALLALPYTVFSVYYQGFILQNWCSLCLSVQGLLLMEGILAIRQLTVLPSDVQPYLLALVAFLLPTLVWVVLKMLLATLPKSRREHEELMRLKRNPDLFRALLLQQPEMPPIPHDLSPIILGNPEAEHTITMVTNPYCGPCGRTHMELEQLIQQNQNVKANIIFTSDGSDGPAMQMAVHTLALAKESKSHALTNWYEQPDKKFGIWAKKYPVIADKTNWQEIANQHHKWCRLADIKFTPTLFVDGYLIPEQYVLDKLRWLINELPAQTSKMDLAKSK